MIPGKYDFKIEQGSDFNLVIQWKARDEDGNDEIVDLTGCSASMRVKTFNDSEINLSEFLTTNSVENQFELSIPASETDKFNFHGGVYEFIVTDSVGDLWKLLKGVIKISKKISNGES